VDDPTRLSGEATAVPLGNGAPRDVSPGGSSRDPSPGGSNWSRFAPGTVFAGRFRIVPPLGRGGMGEGVPGRRPQARMTVALKLRPDHLVRDPAHLAQFHNEVRVARTISHRTVCRTYDIGDADGRRRTSSSPARYSECDWRTDDAGFTPRLCGPRCRWFAVRRNIPAHQRFSRPYAGVTIGLLAVIVGLSIFGFVASRGGESLFGRY